MNATVSAIPGSGHSFQAGGIDGAGGGADFLSCFEILSLCTKTRENTHSHCPYNLTKHHPLPVSIVLTG